MKRYKDYMDGVEASDTLHEKLKNLEEPKKKSQPWARYGAVAAALLLVAGVGAYGLSQGGWNALMDHFKPAAEVAPEIADIPAPYPNPDIATEDPNGPFADPHVPADRTGGGYELVDGEMVSYYVLPYIEYGMTKNRSEMAMDWDVPQGSTTRSLTRADIAALFGGEKNLSDHLAWGDYELSGWAAWYEDGSLWGAFINGYKGELDHFEFAFVTGEQYPPTCIMYGGGVTNKIWDVSVTAWGYGGPNGRERRVDFLNDGCGFRFDISASDQDSAQEPAAMLVSRLVRWIAVEGLEPDALTSDGAVLAHPWEADPNYSVGEPIYEENMPDEDSGSFSCPYCADGTVHTHPYDPGVPAATPQPR